MYHNTAPPTIDDERYHVAGDISNFADVGDRREHLTQMKMSSFQNSMAATR